MNIPEPTRPIIVSGYARSGTSLIGQMLRASGEAVIFPEMSVHSTTAQFDLLEQVRATIRAQRWRPFSEADIDARIVELLRRIWGAGRDPDLHDDTGQPRFGLKQPHAEEFHTRFADVLGEWRPQWVYTIREPAGIYHSTLRMAAFGDNSPAQFIERMAGSLACAAELVAAGDGLVIQTDRAAADPEYRKRAVTDLYEFLAMDLTSSVAGFADRWPPINVSEGENRGPLSGDEIEERVAALTADAGYRRLIAEMQRLS